MCISIAWTFWWVGSYPQSTFSLLSQCGCTRLLFNGANILTVTIASSASGLCVTLSSLLCPSNCIFSYLSVHFLLQYSVVLESSREQEPRYSPNAVLSVLTNPPPIKLGHCSLMTYALRTWAECRNSLSECVTNGLYLAFQ